MIAFHGEAHPAHPFRALRRAAPVGASVAHEMTELKGDRPRLFEEPETGLSRPAQIDPALLQARRSKQTDHITSGLVHDFNNLLQTATFALESIQRRISQGRTADLDLLIDAALIAIDRAAALRHRALSSPFPPADDRRPIRVNTVISSMAPLLGCVLDERVKIDLSLADGLSTTICDTYELENVLLNLAINARDAMPNGGRLSIETCHAVLKANCAGLPPGQYVGIFVTDTGIGMTPDVVARAFDAFFTTKPSGQGSGLGLAMTKRFIEQSGGYATIKSIVGKGTTVMLYLPCHEHSFT